MRRSQWTAAGHFDRSGGSATSEHQDNLAYGNSLRLSDHPSVGSESRSEHCPSQINEHLALGGWGGALRDRLCVLPTSLGIQDVAVSRKVTVRRG